MHVQSLSLQSFLLSSLFVLYAAATPIVRTQDAKAGNANHIFNAIHSSMRQWGSSLNHNGMSFFMATVPVDTQLYHGSSSQEVVKGMEWLAFEPEHALVFARSRGPGGRRPGREPGDGEEKEWEQLRRQAKHGHEEHCNMGPDPWSRQGHAHVPPPPDSHHPGHAHGRPNEDILLTPHPPHHDSHPPPPPHHNAPPSPPPPHDDELQHSFSGTSPQPPASTGKGYLHTYIPTRPLRLLYIDGLSAGKTSNGTLDSQDMLLLNRIDLHDSPMGGELLRAGGMCRLASTLWKGRIDGILRMEAGFEIILCDFESTVVRKSMVTYDGQPADDGRDGPPGAGRRQGGVFGGWRYIQAVSERYHGIGGARVTLHYDRFVSVFAYDGEDAGGMGLWDNDVVSDTPHPRLGNASPEQLGKMRDAVTTMVLESGDMGEGRDWQAVTDMVVQRYSEAIHYLHTDGSVRHSKEAFAKYLSALLRPFVSPSARNATLETERCVAQLIPPFPFSPSSSPSLAHTTLHAVTNRICSTLLGALDASTLTPSRSLAATSSPPYRALDLVDDLVGYLQWTTWKECGPCADQEVCFIPIWPMGSLENHRKPLCVTEDGVGEGYWGHVGPPPEGHLPDGEHHPVHARPGPEGPKLGKHQGTDRPRRPFSAHGREGKRPQHGGRRKGGHCAPPRQIAPPSRFHNLGGWDRGVWNRHLGSLMRMIAWFFGPGPVTQEVEVKVDSVDTRQR